MLTPASSTLSYRYHLLELRRCMKNAASSGSWRRRTSKTREIPTPAPRTREKEATTSGARCDPKSNGTSAGTECPDLCPGSDGQVPTTPRPRRKEKTLPRAEIDTRRKVNQSTRHREKKPRRARKTEEEEKQTCSATGGAAIKYIIKEDKPGGKTRGRCGQGSTSPQKKISRRVATRLDPGDEAFQ